MKIIEIKKDNIGKKAVSFKWEDRSTEFVEKLSQKWLDDNFAESILLFFNANGKKLHAFMTINPISSKLFLKREREELKIIEAKSIPVEDPSLTKEDKTDIERVLKEKYHWSGGDIFKISNNGNVENFEKFNHLVEPSKYDATYESGPVMKYSSIAKKSGAKKACKKFGVKKVAKKKSAKKPTTKKVTKMKAATKKPAKKKVAGKKTITKKSGSKIYKK